MRPVRAAGSVLVPVLKPVLGLLGDAMGLVPALLAGAGVFLVVAGLFNYFTPISQGQSTPTAEVTFSPEPFSLPPRPTASRSASVGPSSSGSIEPSPTDSWAIATRIVIPALNIDLPIQASPANERFPLCNTAEYLTLAKVYAYPGAPQVTYLYAHARIYMFWQLLAQSKINNGDGMLGDLVLVYTDDNQNHVYEISQVIRHVPPTNAFADQALAVKSDELWMQTSEGHLDSSTKLQVVATPVGVLAASQADSHPKLTGTVCPDAPLCTAAGQGGCRKA